MLTDALAALDCKVTTKTSQLHALRYTRFLADGLLPIHYIQ